MSGNRRAETVGRQDIDGVLVVDKPPNMSSARVVTVVKKALGADKVGHAGTLDPFAEGVLVCCVNQATRLAGFLMHGLKKYDAVLRLGQETDTQDLTGTVVSTAETVDCSRQTIESVIESFKGAIDQLPPVFSALKHKGVPLYKLARRGQPVQKPPRRVHVHDIRIVKLDLPYVRLEVSCSAGTYIRTLGADIGRQLGCGGHLNALKRIESSGFRLDQAVSLAELEKSACSRELSKYIISMRDALPDILEFGVDDQLADKIRHGQQLTAGDLAGSDGEKNGPNSGEYLKIVDRKNNLIAIVEPDVSAGRLKYCCVFQKHED
jgi:tRNA pseudouridine55 synthase